MKLKIEITMDNAAFEDAAGLESARILHKLADRIEGFPFLTEGNDQPLRDANGNEVGFATVTA
jgi:hypothetical protein